MRLFLSYRTQDGALAERLCSGLRRRRPGLEIFFDRDKLVLGDIWQQRLADELSAADAVLLLLGRGLGPWQEREFQEAQRLQLLAGRERQPRIIPIALTADAPLPAFAALYHHLTAPEPDAEGALDSILAALDHTAPADQTPDWRRLNPYKGLAALGAADAAYFFGREQESAALLQRIREQPGKVLMLVGNSGVGKTSLIQAGVIDALRTQRWPGTERHEPGQWIGGLTDSHRWPVIVFRPGEKPLLALALAFLSLVMAPSAALEKEATDWAGLLLSGTSLDRLCEHVGKMLTTRTGEPAPRRFLVYIDQGEELYARSASEQRARFSSLIAEAAGREEFQILSSLRADYYGRLQADLTLINASERVDLLPMSAAALTRAMAEPARRLGVRFEPADAAGHLAGLAASQSGALPLLSDLMAELWREMEQRGDGILNWSGRADLVDVGRPLSARADRYLAGLPGDREPTRALFTLHLAHVPVLGEPVRRRALKGECTEEQWRIVERLSGPDWRLLTVSEEAATHEPTVEVAHEQLLRSWTTLRDWLKESREFLVWKGTLEQARQDWLAAAGADDALLMGRALVRAQYWRNERRGDLRPEELSLIEASEQREARIAQKEREAEAERLRLVAEQLKLVTEQQKAEAARIAEQELATQRERRAAKRFWLVTAAGVVVMCGLAWFAWDRYAEASKQHGLAETANTEASTQRDLAEQANAEASNQRGLAEKNYADASDQRKLAVEERKRTQETQSRLMAQASQNALMNSNSGTALALAVEALPRDVAHPDRPYVVEAEHALQDAIRFNSKELTDLRGHEDEVLSAVFSADGLRVLTASEDKTARLWETASGKELAVLRGHESTVYSAVFSPDGSRVLTASLDYTARLWEAASGKELAVLRGHDGPVFSAVFSPDGSRVVTTSLDYTARLWEAASGKELAVLHGHVGSVLKAMFSADGLRVLTASYDHTARLWEAANGRELVVLRGHEGPVFSAMISADGLRVLTASADRTARLWEAASGKELAVLRGHEDGVASAVFSADGTRALTASADRTVRLWEAASGKQLSVLRGHVGEVRKAVFSADELWVVTASFDKTARLWEVASGKELAVLRGHEEWVLSAEFSTDGLRVLTASFDKTARLWEAASGKELAVLRGHEGTAVSAVSSADGLRVLTASEDKTARLWETASGKELAVLRGHEGTLYSAVFSPDGSRVLTASFDKTARLWEAASGKELAVLRGHEGTVYSAVISPDGSRVVTASLDKTARLWEAASGKELAVLRGHAGTVESAVFSADSARVLTASEDKTARLWEVASGKQLAILRGHEGTVYSAAFSPDGSRVLTASADRTARLWEAASGKEPVVLRGHEDVLRRAVFSADGARVVTASLDKTARLWEAASGKELAVLRGHAGTVESAVISPDGSRVVTASLDKTARLWEAASGKELAVLRGHAGTVESAVFSADSARVLTASRDQTARLWEAASGKELAVLRGHEDTVESAVFSGDGKWVVTASRDKTARLWRNFAKTQQLIDYACLILPRPLTREQRQQFFLDNDPQDWPCGWSPDMKQKPDYSAKAVR